MRRHCELAPKAMAVAILAGLLFQQPAHGQIGPPNQRALDNVSGGALRGRAPGNLVSAGVGRAIEITNAAQAPIQITETTPPTSIRAGVIAESINIVFQQVNQAISLLYNLLLARAGRPPQIPIAKASLSTAADQLPAIGSLSDASKNRPHQPAKPVSQRWHTR